MDEREGAGVAEDLRNVVVTCDDGGDAAAARELAARLGAPLEASLDKVPAGRLVLVVRPTGLALVADGMELTCDFTACVRRLRPDRLAHEHLVRAARMKGVEHPRAIDATAGLGEDALLLAASGFTVELFESDPVIAALLADGLRRARAVPALAEVASRMHLTAQDSIPALRALERPVDVVYLDPMFPERRKSAQVKKKFQLLHLLERPCANAEELLEAALAARPRKIVVKRPVKGPVLAGVKPSYSIAGKAVRFDCIVPAR